MRRLCLAVVAVLACVTSCTAQAEPVVAPPPVTTSAAPVPTTTAAPPPPPAPPCARTVRACVSLSMKLAWLVRRGAPDYGPVPIAHGARSSPTPTGTYPVAWKDAENTSSIYGTPMPYSVFFAPGGIAFHEGDVRTDSHGCVRLAMAAARVFFNRLRPGELVEVVP